MPKRKATSDVSGSPKRVKVSTDSPASTVMSPISAVLARPRVASLDKTSQRAVFPALGNERKIRGTYPTKVQGRCLKRLSWRHVYNVSWLKSELELRKKLKKTEDIKEWGQSIYKLFGLKAKGVTYESASPTEIFDVMFYIAKTGNLEPLKIIQRCEYIELEQQTHCFTLDLPLHHVTALYGNIKTYFSLVKFPAFKKLANTLNFIDMPAYFCGVAFDQSITWFHAFLLKYPKMFKKQLKSYAFNNVSDFDSDAMPVIFYDIVKFSSPKSAYEDYVASIDPNDPYSEFDSFESYISHDETDVAHTLAWKPIQWAVCLGRAEWVDAMLTNSPALLDEELSANFYSKPISLLDLAGISGQTNVLNVLLKHLGKAYKQNESGLDTSWVNEDFVEPIYYAIYNNNPGCLSALLTFFNKFAQADVVKNHVYKALKQDYPTYFFDACKLGNEKCLDVLLEQGFVGQPFTCVKQEYSELVDDYADDKAVTSLDFATKYGFSNVVRALLKKVANPDEAQKEALQRAREIAVSYEQQDCVKMIDTILQQSPKLVNYTLSRH